MDVCTISQVAVLNKDINIFNGVLDTDCTNVASIKAVLKAIKEGRWKEEIEWYRQEEDKAEREDIKKQFPAVTFSGVFKDRRLDVNLIYHTGILVVDIDKKDMTMSYEKTLDCVKKTPFIFCAFESPSYGIKALAYIGEDPARHKIIFNGVEEYFADQYGIVIDKSGKNPSRLCFISWDPDLYFTTKEKRIFDIKTDSPKTHITEVSMDYEEIRTADYSKYKVTYDIRVIMDIAKKRAVKGVGAYAKGNRNIYVFYLSCIFNRAGIDESIAIDVIFINYQSLGLDEISRTVKSAYRHNKDEFGTKPISVKDDGQKKML